MGKEEGGRKKEEGSKEAVRTPSVKFAMSSGPSPTELAAVSAADCSIASRGSLTPTNARLSSLPGLTIGPNKFKCLRVQWVWCLHRRMVKDLLLDDGGGRGRDVDRQVLSERKGLVQQLLFGKDLLHDAHPV